MPPRAADRFDEMLVRLLTVWLNRLDTAPNSERWMLTVFIASSIDLMAAIAFGRVSRGGKDAALKDLDNDEFVPFVEMLKFPDTKLLNDGALVILSRLI